MAFTDEIGREAVEVGITRSGTAGRAGARAKSERTKSDPNVPPTGRSGEIVTATKSAIADAIRIQ
jgi:hypothetical protein